MTVVDASLQITSLSHGLSPFEPTPGVHYEAHSTKQHPFPLSFSFSFPFSSTFTIGIHHNTIDWRSIHRHISSGHRRISLPVGYTIGALLCCPSDTTLQHSLPFISSSLHTTLSQRKHVKTVQGVLLVGGSKLIGFQHPTVLDRG